MVKTLTGIVELGDDVYIEDNNINNVNIYYGDAVEVNSISSDTANISQSISAGGNLFVSGNLGIGTSNVMTRLTFSSATEPKISLYQYSATQYYGFGYGGTAINYHIAGSTGSHIFYQGGLNGNGTELFRIKGSGNVSIGVGSNPIGKLNVKGDANITGNILTNGNVSGNCLTFNTGTFTNLNLNSTVSIDTANITTANIKNGSVSGNLKIVSQLEAGSLIMNGNILTGDNKIELHNTYNGLIYDSTNQGPLLYGYSNVAFGTNYPSGITTTNLRCDYNSNLYVSNVICTGNISSNVATFNTANITAGNISSNLNVNGNINGSNIVLSSVLHWGAEGYIKIGYATTITNGNIGSLLGTYIRSSRNPQLCTSNGDGTYYCIVSQADMFGSDSADNCSCKLTMFFKKTNGSAGGILEYFVCKINGSTTYQCTTLSSENRKGGLTVTVSAVNGDDLKFTVNSGMYFTWLVIGSG